MEIRVNIEFACSMCGNDLYGEQDRKGTIKLEPCEKCLEEANEEGKREGRYEE